MSLAERLALVETKLEGRLATDDSERICFTQAQSVLRVWPKETDLEEVVSYLEYRANNLGV